MTIQSAFVLSACGTGVVCLQSFRPADVAAIDTATSPTLVLSLAGSNSSSSGTELQSNGSSNTARMSNQQTVASPPLLPGKSPGHGRIIGWISSISSSDGVISGWAADTQNPQEALKVAFYSDAPSTQGGTLMGTVVANAVSLSATYMYGLSGSHGFNFEIPSAFKNGQTRNFYAQASNGDGSISQVLSGSVGFYNLNPIAPTTTVTNYSSCLAPQSKCVSLSFDFGVPNFPSATAWGDGNDYFTAWGCVSSVGLNHIVRLNIVPYEGSSGTKYHDNNFQKDSLLVNMTDQMYGRPIIYFTSSRYNTYSSVYSLKKAVYGPHGNWQIFDMLDYPSNSGGFSSLDGRYPAFIMNDYSQPGWGPTSPYPGTDNYIPGVDNVAVNPENNSFPLIGSGPNGLTAIVNRLQGPGVTDGGVTGRTCIHMNPKLFDYNSNGEPQSMVAYLFQEATTGAASPCSLPDGSNLPSVGYYVYHFQGGTGWQLDRSFGPIESGLNPDQALKLASNTNGHTFIAGNWNGQITTVNLDNPPPRKRTVILSCGSAVNGSTAKFAEATGNTHQVWFLAIPPGAPMTYGNGVFTGDIYYAYSASAAVSRALHSRPHAKVVTLPGGP
jgi:hypothetical protein